MKKRSFMAGNLNWLFKNAALFAKKLTGRLNIKESEEFNLWLAWSEQNRLFFNRLRNRQNFCTRNEEYEKTDVFRAWKRVSGAIALEKKKIRSFYLRFAAAVMLLILLAGGVVYRFVSNGDELDYRAVSGITPGNRAATLVLSNGEKIDLQNRPKKTLKEVDGSIIEMEGNELNYTGQEPKKYDEELMEELHIPRSGEYSLVLSDGTKVFLNSMSKLTFPVRFSGGMRKVTLEGEACFEVRKDTLRPFIVHTSGLQVQVLGTTFNVKAYPDESHIYATLVEGSVRINTPEQQEPLILEPDRQAIYTRGETAVQVREVDAAQFTAWTRGQYLFEDQTLDEMMTTLSRWYDFTYRYSNDSLKTIRFGGKLDKSQSIYPILKMVQATGKVKVTVNEKEVTFTK
jgi:ferric-dicitrate binding protein FerR (iron transport regulator)